MRNAGAKLERRRIRKRTAQREAPSVLPKLRSHRERRTTLAHHAQFLDRAPTSPGDVGQQLESLSDALMERDEGGIWQLEIDAHRAIRERTTGAAGSRDDRVHGARGARRRLK